ncbi:unnamed protein product, partial [Urochloa humidicola]
PGTKSSPRAGDLQNPLPHALLIRSAAKSPPPPPSRPQAGRWHPLLRQHPRPKEDAAPAEQRDPISRRIHAPRRRRPKEEEPAMSRNVTAPALPQIQSLEGQEVGRGELENYLILNG